MAMTIQRQPNPIGLVGHRGQSSRGLPTYSVIQWRSLTGLTMSERGTYVVIEGIDGTGKTLLTARLLPALLARGHSISSFHEPNDKFLRDEFARLIKIEALAAALCQTVDRAILRPQIERALEQGDVVLQDRSFYSTLAYQFPGLPSDSWRELERVERTVSLEPDLVLYLDAPVELAMKRVESSGKLDAFEDEPYLSKVKRKFEQMFQPPRWVRINATGGVDDTLEQAINALMASGL
jgi:dTMP kinase